MLVTTKRPLEAAARGPIEVVRRGATIGAEIKGVDFAKPVPPATIAAIRDALAQHAVIFFRDADMTPAQQVAFGRAFGELTVHPFVPHLAEFPEMVVLDNHADNPVFSTDHWHSDETFRVAPPMGSILRCLAIPATGGETLWADMCAAYDGLSDKMQHFLSGLEAIHDFINFRQKFDDLPPRERHAKLAAMEEDLPNPAHPVVRTHPVTGRKALFVNEQFTLKIKGMREDESRALLDFLFAQPRIPEYQFRFHWEVNSMVFWDNAPLQHYAANDYYPQRRTMHRVTIKGGKPF
ncbi:MAG TPA: TauD/TfdA family dioxygenase [Stellaceae bacterium]|jgi:taurine dioxygenase|nr:TauD/TfdA family dioxygenase [Stellaceae bacterium]